MTGSLDPSTARIIDANANRLREGLRVAEEFARLVVGSAASTRRLKKLRHTAAQISRSILPSEEALASRSIEDDVGTQIFTSDEMRRATEQEVAISALKRSQESLRVLEEYAKLVSADAASAFEKMRYELYSVEKELMLTDMAVERLSGVRLYVIVTESLCSGPLLDIAAAAMAGGADMLEYREKHMEDGEFLEKARQLREMTREAGALLIINDRPHIARIAAADGVHLGQGDLAVSEARAIVGPGAIIGRSTHSVQQARQAMLDKASYLAIGPIWKTPTKDAYEAVGLETASQVFSEARLPAFAIGGIDLDNVDEVIEAGASRVVVCRAVIGASDVEAAARELRARLPSSHSTTSPSSLERK